VQGDTIAAQAGTQMVVAGLARDVVSLAGLFAVAISIDPWWTAAALVGAPLLLLPALVLQRYIRRKTLTMREQSGLRATRLDEVFHGIAQVKLNRMERYQGRRFALILDRIVRAEVKSATGRAAMPALVDVVTGLGFFAVLILGGGQVVEGARTTGEFMAFFTAMALTFQPIRRLSDLAGQWQIARASLERIFALFDTAPALRRPAESRAQPHSLPPRIEFRDVDFGYEGTAVLRGLSFTAEAGRVTALVGASGAGKSTVFHLLAGLADPEAGEIRIGGAEVRDLSLSDQRRLFAAVTQEPALFDETLRENLVLGREGLDGDRPGRRHGRCRGDRIRRPPARGAGDARRPARLGAVGRPAPAHRDCPGASGRCAGAALGRGDQRAGCGLGNRGDGGAGAGAGGPHDAGDRASPGDGARRRPYPGAGSGPRGRTGPACRSAGAGRALCPAACAAIPRLTLFLARPPLYPEGDHP
jgi:hypothetical protein